MSTKNKNKICSTLLRPDERELIEKLVLETGITESGVLRMFIRIGAKTYKSKKISSLKLFKLSAY